MNFGIFCLIWMLFKTSRCSVVSDGREKGIYLADYCPKMEYCEEGAHVMCMYYDPRSVMGPRCNDPRNVSITRDLANKLLEVANAIRSKLALGKEKGSGGVILPRAYSMFKLKWDSELATFAQVLANQCVLRHDMCRSSKKFPDPGQTAGLVRFTHPDWFPVSHNAQFTKSGLTISKLSYATTQSLKSWYSHKDFVNADMIAHYPDWAKHPDKTTGRLYLEMIHNSATHMGCGMSAYTEYAYHDNKADLTYNSVQIICNYSSRPQKGQPVYRTHPPSEVGMTIRCGCPEGYEEDADCLCVESPPRNDPPPKSCDGVNCKPAVVLLPIFTVEDAPQMKLNSRQSLEPMMLMRELNGENVTGHNQETNDIFSHLENQDNDLDAEPIFGSIPPIIQSVTNYTKRIERQGGPRLRVQQARPQYDKSHRNEEYLSHIDGSYNDKSHVIDVKKRYFDKKAQSAEHKPQFQHSLSVHVPSKKTPHIQRKSIFSRVHTFELPGLTRRDDSFRARMNDIIKDVAPRRDFSNAQRLLNTYLNKRRHHEAISPQIFSESDDESPKISSPKKEIITTEKPLENKKDYKVINFNHYLKNKFHYQDFNISNEPINRIDIPINSSNEESDRKLMALLDNLEQEVKHIELDVNEKQLFDAKIRKIYGTVVGKSPDLLSSKIAKSKLLDTKYDSSGNSRSSNNVEDINKRIYETENRVKELHSKMYDKYPNWKGTRARKQSLLSDDEKAVKEVPKHCLKMQKGRPCLYTNKRNVLDSEEVKSRTVYSSNDDKNFIDKIDENYREKFKHSPMNEEVIEGSDDNPDNEVKSRPVYKSDSDNSDLNYRQIENGFLDETRRNVNFHRKVAGDKMLSKHIYRNEVNRNGNLYDMDTKSRHNYKNKESYLDPLSVDRRMYYQDKLNNLERKLSDSHNFNRRRSEHERERAVRLMRPSSRDEVPVRSSARSKNQISTFYKPDRARFLHGF